MTNTGNLPPSTSVNTTTQYFNNYFSEQFTTSPNIDDAVLAYFQTLTGSIESGRILASTIIYTALSQGIDPLSIVDEFKKLSNGRTIEVKVPLAANSVVSTYKKIQEIQTHKEEYEVGQIFYVPTTDMFYQLRLSASGVKQVVAVSGYKAEMVPVSTYITDITAPLGSPKVNYTYDFFTVTYKTEKDELTPYITMLLNSNRVGTSLLGLSNSPEVNKYVSRSIRA